MRRSAGASRRLRLAIRLVSIGALFAACGGEREGRPRPDSPSPAPAAPSRSAPAALPGQWRLTEDGFGPLLAGMTLEQARSVVPGDLDAHVASPDAACTYATWSAVPEGIRVMFDEGVVARVEVDTPAIRTEAGGGVGDSEARIDSLYPGRVRRMPHKYTDGRYLIVLAATPRDTMFRFVFESDGNLVTTMRSGRYPQVEWVEGCA